MAESSKSAKKADNAIVNLLTTDEVDQVMHPSGVFNVKTFD